MKSIGYFRWLAKYERRAKLIVEHMPASMQGKGIETLFIDMSGASFTKALLREKRQTDGADTEMLGINCAISGVTRRFSADF